MKKELITKQEALTYLDQGKKGTSEFLYRVLNSIDWEGGGGGDGDLAKYFSERGYGYVIPEGIKTLADSSYAMTSNWTVYNEDWYMNVIDSSTMYYIKMMPSLPLELSETFPLFNVLGNKQSLLFAPELDLSEVTSLENVFSGSMSLVYIPWYNTSKVTNLNHTFSGTAITTIPLYDTSKVITMDGTFSGCRSLLEIPLLDTSNVITMNGLFNGCENLLKIPLLNTAKVTDMSFMFSYCTKLEQIPELNMTNVISINGMFGGNDNLKSTDIINSLDVSKVQTMESLFSYCKGLTNIVPFNATMAKNVSLMFEECLALKEVPNLIFPSAEKASGLFKNCVNLTKVGTITLPKIIQDFSQDPYSPNLDIFWSNHYSSSTYKNLTDFGGFPGIKVSFSLEKCPALSIQSLLNVLNGLVDLTGQPTKTCKLGTENFAKLSSEHIAIATAKNWYLY